MSEFKIEKNIPKPKIRGSGVHEKYPWRAMEIGDSFFVPGKSAGRFASIASVAGKRLGRRFTTRTVDGGVRIWREE